MKFKRQRLATVLAAIASLSMAGGVWAQAATAPANLD